MNREDFSFTSDDGLEIACFRWQATAPSVGVLQIAHGMGEHSLRYEHVAEFLNAAGFHVYANDHRGHGRTAPDKESLGELGAGGWNALVEDMFALSNIIRTRDTGFPLILLGHSMGSFAAQHYLLDHSDLLAGAALSGSAAVDKLAIDPTRPADLSSVNEGIAAPRTPFDWLSHDPAVVDAYIADPLCGFGVSAASMMSMAGSAPRLLDPNELKRIRANLPIYIFAGDEDPINHKLEWLKPVAERYRAAGLRHVTEKYYPGGRHEMMNETNREQVLKDLLDWMRHAVHTRHL
jgi:alpha-beta hydrolase superfamily lysophospholipase